MLPSNWRSGLETTERLSKGTVTVMPDDDDFDVAEAPQLFQNHGGAPVRITCFWTTDSSTGATLQWSLDMLKFAADIFSKYTLTLDVFPALSAPLPQALLDWDEPVISFPTTGSPEVMHKMMDFLHGQEVRLRSKIAEVEGADSSRCIVVFNKVVNDGGITVREREWLPWSIVDPQSSVQALAHEIGHAAGCNHSDFGNPTRRNIMSYESSADRFHPWQVNKIAQSFFCKGQRPRDWYTPINDRRFSYY
jgi:hypothetical protein